MFITIALFVFFISYIEDYYVAFLLEYGINFSSQISEVKTAFSESDDKKR